MKKVNLVAFIPALLTAAVLIGSWLIVLSSVSLETITRGHLVLFRFSDSALTATTVLMLVGVVILSISVASIVERVAGRGEKH